MQYERKNNNAIEITYLVKLATITQIQLYITRLQDCMSSYEQQC